MTPFLLAFLASLSVAAKPAAPARPKQEPLVLDGARSFVVTGRGSSVELTGDVRFHREDVKFSSDRAVWDRAQDVVRLEGAFQLTHPSGSIVSQTGRYERSSGSAWAEGDAVLADSSGDITITAGIIRYDRTARIAEARREPVFRRRSTSDSTKGWDTIKIKA